MRCHWTYDLTVQGADNSFYSACFHTLRGAVHFYLKLKWYYLRRKR